MRVLMLNGNPHEKGCTCAALVEVTGELNQTGVGIEIMHVGGGTIHGCIGCGACGKLGKCTYSDDKVNEAVEEMRQSDGLTIGSPIHYASTSGAATSFLGRLFYSGSSAAAHKPGAAVVSTRRAGTTATLNQLDKHLMITQMPIVSSQYWNMMCGQCPEDVKKDEEDVQIMRVLGRNVIWILKSIEAGEAAGITLPETGEKERTDFTR